MAEQKDRMLRGEVFGEELWIGGGAIVLPGVTISDRTTVDAGSVATKDLPADIMAVGGPAWVSRQL